MIKQLPIESWTPEDDGTIICFECEVSFDRTDIYGDPRWSDPLCLDCYETKKYER